MSESKRQSLIIIGVGLILLSIVMLYFALSQPKEYVVDEDLGKNSLQFMIEKDSTGEPYETSQSTQVQSQIQTQPKSSSNSSAPISQEVQTTQATESSKAISYPLNINTCTADELKTIEGIGDVKAYAIIEYRDYLGGYTSVQQIKNIKGIGDKIYEKIAPYLTV